LPWADLTIRAAAAEWELGGGGAGWELRGPGEQRPSGILLRPAAGAACSLVRAVELEAAAVDEVVVELATPWWGRARLAWTAPGAPFSAERSIEDVASAVGGPGKSAFHFPLRGHPGWHGQVAGLRLTVPPSRALDLEIAAIRAYGWHLEASRVAASGERAHRVELGHERRDALVADPNEPWTWRIGDAGGRRLAFGFGTGPQRSGRVVFRVWSEEAGERALVWEAVVGPGGLPDGRWHQAHLALPRDLPDSTLALVAEYEPSLEAVDALGFWAAPELVPPDPPAERPDIVLVSIDTLRADRMSLYGHVRATTPSLDAWARQAAVFERAFTSSPWTLPAHLSLFTGLDALRHGVNHRTRVPDGIPLLAERLRAAGYQTLAVTGGGYLAPEFGLDRGFERYRWWAERRDDEGELVENVRSALAWLDEPPRRPFFLFFHTYETHHPHRVRQPYFDRLAGGVDPEPFGALGYVTLPQDPTDGFLLGKGWRLGGQPLKARDVEVLGSIYDSGVAYADAELAPFLERLAAGEAGRRTVVAVVSDHGESLGEEGLAGHAYLDDANARVPLVLRLPGGASAGRIGEQVRLLDLAPTLLELAGVGAPQDIDGRSLLPLLAGPEERPRPAWTYAAFSNRGLALRLDRRWKYLFNDTAWAPLAGQEALVDLGADPKQPTARVGDPRLEVLRHEVVEALVEVAGAVRLRFANATSSAIAGRLVGAPVQPSRVKSPRVPRGAVRWQGPRVAVLELPPGETFDLLLENPPGDRVEVHLEPGFEATLVLADLGAGWRAVLDAGRWRVAAPGEPAAQAEVSVAWNRTFGAGTQDPAATDAALREQLKALGYVE
jgi:arylsulfatase A-like enzyme